MLCGDFQFAIYFTFGNRVLISHKREWNWVSSSEAGEPVCAQLRPTLCDPRDWGLQTPLSAGWTWCLLYSAVSQKERNKYCLLAQYLESRTGPVSLLAGQEQRLGLEHRLVDTAREGEVAEGREPAGPQPYRVQAGSVCTCCLTLAVRVLPHFYLSFKTRLWFQVPLEAKSELSHKVWIGLYGIPKALCTTAILALTRHRRTVTQLSPNWTVNS